MRYLWLFLILPVLVFKFDAYSDEHQQLDATGCRLIYNTAGECNNGEKNKPPIPASIVCSVGNYRDGCLKDNKHKKLPSNNSEKSADFIGIESYRTAKEDLVAQQSMDEAASEMVSISIDTYNLLLLSLVISCVGILLLWRTLDATRSAIEKADDANKIARNASILQLQPWISIDKPRVGRAIRHKEIVPTKFKVTIDITNNGKSPVNHALLEVKRFDVFLRKETTTLCLEPVRAEAFPVRVYRPINPEEKYSFVFECSFLQHPHSTMLFNYVSGADANIEFTIFANLRFQDISTVNGKHRCISFNIGTFDKGDDASIQITRETTVTNGDWFDWIDNLEQDKQKYN